MTHEQILDELLPCLADEFESGNRNGGTIERKTTEEFEPLPIAQSLILALRSWTVLN
jgi:hypothetical protein